MNPHKNWAKKILLFFSAALLAVAAVNFFADPYQLYFSDDVFNANERYANVGLARNHDYDGIIIGTSMTENFSPAYIRRKLGLNVVKLSIAGGTAFEQKVTAEEALSGGKVKAVIWGLDYLPFAKPSGSSKNEFPLYLYGGRSLKEAKCLLSMDTLKLSFKKISFKIFNKKSREFTRGIEENYSWYGRNKDDFNIGHYKANMDELRPGIMKCCENPGETLRTMKENFESNLLVMARNNPDTLFYIFFPPYSALFYYDFYEKSVPMFNNMLAFKKYVACRASGYPNVKLYDFQSTPDIACNISLYMDLTHYHPSVNNYIIDSISEGRCLITKENVDDANESLTGYVETLNPKELLQEIHG